MKNKETPMMQQYNKIKAQYQDAFLFYRLGDFYELFNEDAIVGSQILELTLTQRNKNSNNPIPMAGVPYHSAQNYIDILVDKGYKVAIVEQMEDPSQSDGMVKREVVQLITPGTRMDINGSDVNTNNYLVGITFEGVDNYGLAYTDLSTGEIAATNLSSTVAVVNEVTRLSAKEIVTDKVLPNDLTASLNKLDILISTQSLKDVSIEQKELFQDLEYLSLIAAQILVIYLYTTQKRMLEHLQPARAYKVAQYLKMDRNSRDNLELTVNLRTKKRDGTLLWLLDETKTAMGGRLLKQWIDQPLIDKEELMSRYDKIDQFMQNFLIVNDLQKTLKSVYDLERLVGKVAYGNANGRDLLKIRNSLRQIPIILELLNKLDFDVFGKLISQIDSFEDLENIISDSIIENPPLSITDGEIIKTGYNKKLDDYRNVLHNGKKWLAELEARERYETGINSLKIGFNKVFGYYIEVTKSNIEKLDVKRYIRKQTLVNAERFITPELKEHEQKILEATSKSSQLEYELFTNVREKIKDNIKQLQRLAKQLATLDVLISLADVAQKNQFTRPQLNTDHLISVVDGRHPVVEKVLGYQEYVANDIMMDCNQEIMLITGPNMSGKSTYMRQLALMVVMAQIGSFVPAKSAELPIVDQIFTRIGAADDLISGNSTFMVEMSEANIALQTATDCSLILFDELGRGTATFDGMALAQAIIEYVHQNIHAKTLFSTHYHELTNLSKDLSKLFNVHVGANEKNEKLIFSHKVLSGPSDQSYGISVAKLAGLPQNVIKRATIILKKLEKEGNDNIVKLTKASYCNTQMSLFEESVFDNKEKQIVERIKNADLVNLTPVQSLILLNELQELLKR